MQTQLFDAPCPLPQAPTATQAQLVRHPWWLPEQAAEPGRETVDLFNDACLPDDVQRYGSGCSALWDFLGFALVHRPVGVTATKLGTAVMPKILAYLDRGGRVMVDSGVFGAYRANRPLDFEKSVFPRYEQILSGTRQPSGVLLVAPDVLGDQISTLQLQRQHLPRIVRWMDLGASVMFPIQDAHNDPAAVHRQIRSMVGQRSFVVGIPSNEQAWLPHQVVSFAQREKPQRMHLLGVSRDSLVRQIAREVAAVSPGTRLSCDACPLIAHAGTGRRLTDRARSRLESAIEAVERGEYGDVLPDLDMFRYDIIYTPNTLSAQQAIALGNALGRGGPDWHARFVAASKTGFQELFAEMDPHEDWLHEALYAALQDSKDTIYRPWLRSILRGPIRAWEVGRLACGQDPETLLPCAMSSAWEERERRRI